MVPGMKIAPKVGGRSSMTGRMADFAGRMVLQLELLMLVCGPSARRADGGDSA